MDYGLVLAVFVGGLLFKLLQLPPLAGFLGAGFALNALGFQNEIALDVVSHIGITLLLFGIGLKIQVRSLLKKEILLGCVLQTSGVIAGVAIFFELIILAGLQYFTELTLLQSFYIGVALSFSSTVCAVKILEDKNELKTRHGQIALSILIVQDILAVIFLAILEGKWPSYWALALLALPLMKPVMSYVLSKAEHGEMLPLAGIFLALSGAELFKWVGIKGDVGALVFGMLLSGDKKSSELAKTLMSFKDLFLIAFFLSIGLESLPTKQTFIVSLVLLVFVFAKQWVFFLSLVVCQIRARTAFLAALALGNYSEFGLIVTALAAKQGLLTADWLLIIALTVSMSFILTSFINKKSHSLYASMAIFLKFFQTDRPLAEDKFYQPLGAEILVLGMGRVGRGSYDALVKHGKGVVWGVDASAAQVNALLKSGYLVTVGDAEDVDFWEKVDLTKISVIMLAMPGHDEMLESIKRIKSKQYAGKIAGIAKYEDQRQELLNMGVDVAFNFYAEAGAGFAEESLHLLDDRHAVSGVNGW